MRRKHVRRLHFAKMFWMLLVAGLLQACGVPRTAEEFDSTAEARYLRATVDKLARQDYAAIESALDPRINQPNVHAALLQLHMLLPKEAPDKTLPVDWRFFKQETSDGHSERTASVAMEYQYPSAKWIAASAVLSGEPGNFRIVSFNIEVLPASLADLNAFGFAGKGPVHYVFLVLTIGTALLSLYAFVRCLRTKGLRRKWLWAIVTLVTVCGFGIDWSSGETGFQLLRLNLLGWGAGRAGWLGPWMISFPIPVGALVFLLRYRKGSDVRVALSGQAG
jgi:hypothetical protein